MLFNSYVKKRTLFNLIASYIKNWLGYGYNAANDDEKMACLVNDVVYNYHCVLNYWHNATNGDHFFANVDDDLLRNDALLLNYDQHLPNYGNNLLNNRYLKSSKAIDG